MGTINKVGMLKESGVIKRIILKIPQDAHDTFANHQYNPDKRDSQDPVFAEAEYEENVDEVEVEAQRTSAPKRPGSIRLRHQKPRWPLGLTQWLHIEIQNRK